MYVLPLDLWCHSHTEQTATVALFLFNHFIFFLALSFFYFLKMSHGVVECPKRIRYSLSSDLKRSVLAHAHVLQKPVMNVNNAKAIKIILDSLRFNAIPCPSGCFVGVRNQCQTSENVKFHESHRLSCRTKLEKKD